MTPAYSGGPLHDHGRRAPCPAAVVSRTPSCAIPAISCSPSRSSRSPVGWPPVAL